jgi:excisionase family DNA binding protein
MLEEATMNSREGEALLTVDEAAVFLRVNRKTLYEAIQQREVPGVVRLGRVIRIGKRALLDWVRGKAAPALGDTK